MQRPHSPHCGSLLTFVRWPGGPLFWSQFALCNLIPHITQQRENDWVEVLIYWSVRHSTTIASPLCVSWHVYGLCCLLLFLCHMTIEWHLMTTLRSWTFLILQGHFMCSRSDVKVKREINKHRNQHRENENTKNKNIFVIYLTKGSFCQCKLHQIKQSLSVKLHVSDCDWLKESFSVHM